MRPGHNNVAVLELQKSLNFCYGGDDAKVQRLFPKISEDSSYGNQTAGAVRQVQRYYGLSVDGYAGPNTRKTMAHFADNYTCRHLVLDPAGNVQVFVVY